MNLFVFFIYRHKKSGVSSFYSCMEGLDFPNELNKRMKNSTWLYGTIMAIHQKERSSDYSYSLLFVEVSKFHLRNNENIAIKTMSVSFFSVWECLHDSDKGTTFWRKNARLCKEIFAFHSKKL